MPKAPNQARRVLWIKIEQHGKPVWVNTSKLRCIEADHRGCVLIFNTKHKVDTDQTIEEVMQAMGHPMPPREPVETHEVEVVEPLDC